MINLNESKLARVKQLRESDEARAYLARTDWYVIRMQETGAPVPAEVLEARQAAREAIVALLD